MSPEHPLPNDPYTAPAPPDAYAAPNPLQGSRRAENRFRAVVDAEGYVTRLLTQDHEEDDQFMTFMSRNKTPVDPNDIVMPPGYTLHPDGSYTKVVSHEGAPVAQITVTHEPR